MKSNFRKKDNRRSKWHNIKWLNAAEIFETVKIFNETIIPNCIRQGALNNCYFLSAIAALAEKPERIKNLFLSTKLNEPGIYGIRLCLNGKWQEIFIDDYFPCDSKKSFPCFSYCKDGSLWINILEKCYAKSRGSYYLLEKGTYEQTIRELTGAPILILDNSNENLLANIKEACNKKWIITASAGETEASRELLREVGLIPLHTYIIMDIFDLSQLDENSNFPNNLNVSNSQLIFSNSNYDNILKIKNPWGKNEWIGDWSDYSNLWREDLKLKLNYSISDNCFYMNFKDFKHYFSKIQICKIHDNYIYNSIQISQNLHSYSLVKITISNHQCHSTGKNNNGFNFNFNNINLNNNNFNSYSWNQPVYISLIQNEIKKNMFNIDKKYSIARIILSKLTFNGEKDYEVEYITGKISQEKELYEEKELESGEYILFIEVDRVPDKNYSNEDLNSCEKNFDLHNYSYCSPDKAKPKPNLNDFYNLDYNSFCNSGALTNCNGGHRNNPDCYENSNKPNKNKLFSHLQNKKNCFNDLFIEEKYVISTYSPSSIELKQLRNEDFPNILQKIYISCAKKDNNVLRFTNDGAPNCLK